jgi:hypothetical protein
MVCGKPGSRSSLVARHSGHWQAIPAQSHQEEVKACRYDKSTAKTRRPGRQSTANILENGQPNSWLGVCVSNMFSATLSCKMFVVVLRCWSSRARVSYLLSQYSSYVFFVILCTRIVALLDGQCFCPVIYETGLVPAKHTQPSPLSLSWLVLAASSRFPLDSLALASLSSIHSSYPNISQRRFPDIPISTLSIHLSIPIQSSLPFLLLRPFFL